MTIKNTSGRTIRLKSYTVQGVYGYTSYRYMNKRQLIRILSRQLMYAIMTPIVYLFGEQSRYHNWIFTEPPTWTGVHPNSKKRVVIKHQRKTWYIDL